MPLELLSTTDAGLNITWAWQPLGAGTNEEVGFQASWRNLCVLPGTGERVFSDAVSVSFEGFEFSGNEAAGGGGGGALSMDAAPGFAGTRGATLSLRNGRLWGNAAADDAAAGGDGDRSDASGAGSGGADGGGGAVAVRKNVRFTAEGVSADGNSARNGAVRGYCTRRKDTRPFTSCDGVPTALLSSSWF